MNPGQMIVREMECQRSSEIVPRPPEDLSHASAQGNLTKPERDLLTALAELARRKSDRLRISLANGQA